MFKLRMGYVISGIATGLVLLFSFVATLPDGKLHMVFCDVGQGDAAYIRFPDGRDMLIDGGPNDRVLGCLGTYMPFWDRTLDLVVLTHPEKDHLQGLISVLDRYNVDYFVRSDVANDTEGYKKLMEVVARKKIAEKFVTTGEQITVGSTSLAVLWPSDEHIAKATTGYNLAVNVLGAAVPDNPNEYSVVLWLRYGEFDAIFTGDADTRVEENYRGTPLAPLRASSAEAAAKAEQGFEGQADNRVELLKVPHHGSKTGMSDAFLDWLRPSVAIISVGRNNSYGHPATNILQMLRDRNITIQRTDEEGDITVVSDGNGWKLEK